MHYKLLYSAWEQGGIQSVFFHGIISAKVSEPIKVRKCILAPENMPLNFIFSYFWNKMAIIVEHKLINLLYKLVLFKFWVYIYGITFDMQDINAKKC